MWCYSVQENNGSELIKSIKIQDKGNRQSLIVNLPARSWQEDGRRYRLDCCLKQREKRFGL